MSTGEEVQEQDSREHDDASATQEPQKPSWLPAGLLVVGILLFVVTVVAIACKAAVAALVFGASSAVVGIALTFVIAHNQNKQSNELSKVVTDTSEVVQNVEKVLIELREQASARVYVEPEDAGDAAGAPDAADSDDAGIDGTEAPTGPWWAPEALERLRAVGASLDETDLLWRKRTSIPPMRGNQGWFVESPSKPKAGRWFVRKAHGMDARKAMPREYLEALEAQGPLDPRQIRLDFQLKNHGLAAWYARTYDGDLWKVSRSNRSADGEIHAEKVNELDS
ncbi:hypothetical protein IFT36_04825 [Frigoribacterium sp. CFBP 13605]|uniref:hypothetical protein n=1 Tax=Frigoribacterium sp. CFBP 13605 TaxID=2774034 RepID=UPI001907B7BD|nr:hypothetical protein [Frigoribacterium sp. CFBP 13605]MBD8139867.1 hypothetical protein [Frigoribacterium sp. CFBP 13605]